MKGAMIDGRPQVAGRELIGSYAMVSNQIPAVAVGPEAVEDGDARGERFLFRS